MERRTRMSGIKVRSFGWDFYHVRDTLRLLQFLLLCGGCRYCFRVMRGSELAVSSDAEFI